MDIENAKTNLDFALVYARKGWYVFPVYCIRDGKCSCGKPECDHPGKHPRTEHGHKEATIDESQIIGWWTKTPDANIGVRTGKVSGIAVADIDRDKGGFYSIEELDAPDTLYSQTGGGGQHRVYQYIEGIDTRVGFRSGIDIRSDDAYFVAPPSNHISGNIYFWCDEFLEPAPAPGWMKNNGKYKYATPIPEIIPAGQRNITLTSLAGSMRNKGASQEAIEKALLEENKKCSPSLSEEEVLTIAKSVSRYKPHKEYYFTDLGNAERLVARHKDELRFCHPWNKWLVWDGRCWELDATAAAWRYAIYTVRHMYIEAAATEDSKHRTKISEHAKRSESEPKIRAMLSLAEKQEGIPVRPEELDKDPWLLNVLNETIDLRTGKIREHLRDDLITKLAPVEYKQGAVCPKWQEFLSKVMFGNQELIMYIQRLVGYCLTGRVSEHKLFFLYGSGANGKSTFLKVIQSILGDYAIKAASDLLIAKPGGGGHTTSQTDLKGARLAITIEVQEGQQWAENIVKETTGGDTMTARRMRQDNESWEPTHKIILAANHKPIVNDTTTALWRRIDLIPFAYTFQERERIKDYHEILLNEEKEGILLWALEGCLEWQRVGLSEPEKVLEATKDYRNEMDILGEFIEECCEIEQGAEVLTKYLRARYEKWCDENGEKPITSKAFSQRLNEKGLIRARKLTIQKERGRGWKGLKLKEILDGLDGLNPVSI